MAESRPGYIYVLSNPGMPGIVKIGRSVHGGRVRAKDLYQTGVPFPFELEFEVFVDDPIEFELVAHERLSSKRINESREFFAISPAEARLELLKQSLWELEFAVIDCKSEDALIDLRYLSDVTGIEHNKVCEAVAYISPEAIIEAVSTLESKIASKAAKGKLEGKVS